ncbi:unnamed protein product [Moneuplotes crassus]|uniref:Cytochrome P450 n=1 Tax=Euplotes crassus TaxID=5936 RepID=A0AAD1UJY0_EUPCR|nr:unnamed protein product [Moneuplotes crassus]
MDPLASIWVCIKVGLGIVTCLGVYVLVEFLVLPQCRKRRMGKYSNLRSSKSLMNNMADMKRNIKENKYIFWHFIKLRLTEENYDVFYTVRGNTTAFLLTSVKAYEEFKQLQPDVIDRKINPQNTFTKLAPSAFGNIKSGKEWNKRRNSVSKLMVLNKSSQYIPMMVQSLDAEIRTWKIGQDINVSERISAITLTIITKILFGSDITSKIEDCDYLHPDGKSTKMRFMDFYPKMILDIMLTFSNIKASIFPFVGVYDLVEPFVTNRKNINQFQDKLKKFLANSTDAGSVYRKLIDEFKIPEEDAFQDICGLLFAGHDTTSHAISSAIYFLKKNPEADKKLREALATCGITKDTDYFTIETKEKIQSCEYLNYVIKETLRIDPPAFSSIVYEACRPITLVGVPIKKSESILLNILSLHHDPSQWHEPLKFIPERFDPESEYFLKPDGDTRSLYAYAPFSFGLRKCPGQILATLELKFLLSRFLCTADIEIPESLLENDYARFALFSNFHLEGKVTYKSS